MFSKGLFLPGKSGTACLAYGKLANNCLKCTCFAILWKKVARKFV